jgi:VanZ family protein
MSPQNIGRVAAWVTLAAIIVLSLVPPGARPITSFPHKIEHAGIFLLNGVAFGVAYRGYEWLSSIGAVIFCAGIELAQLIVPGRHARLSDFFVDSIAICVGIFAGSTLIRITRRYT